MPLRTIVYEAVCLDAVMALVGEVAESFRRRRTKAS
jgi:hypothetical protein